MVAASWFQWANWIEAGVWIVMGAGFLAAGLLKGRKGFGQRVFLGIVLVSFGVSDIVEARTGAWYRPVGLLVWKAICVGCLLGAVGMHLRRRRREAKQFLRD